MSQPRVTWSIHVPMDAKICPYQINRYWRWRNASKVRNRNNAASGPRSGEAKDEAGSRFGPSVFSLSIPDEPRLNSTAGERGERARCPEAKKVSYSYHAQSGSVQ